MSLIDELEVKSLLERVRQWFGSDADALAWYESKVIPSFKLTPADIIKQNGAEGLKALNEYVTAKEQGGFE